MSSSSHLAAHYLLPPTNEIFQVNLLASRYEPVPSPGGSQIDTTSTSTTSAARPTWSVTAAANRKAEEEIESRRRGKVKEYVPATLHPITLLCFAALCLGLVAGLEVLLRSKLLVEREFGRGKGGGPLRRDLPALTPVPGHQFLPAQELGPRALPSMIEPPSTANSDMFASGIDLTPAVATIPAAATDPVPPDTTAEGDPAGVVKPDQKPADQEPTPAGPKPESVAPQFVTSKGEPGTEVDARPPEPLPTPTPDKENPLTNLRIATEGAFASAIDPRSTDSKPADSQPTDQGGRFGAPKGGAFAASIDTHPTITFTETQATEVFASGVAVPEQEHERPGGDGASKGTVKAPGDDLGDVVGEVFSTPAPEVFATAVSIPGQEHKGSDGGGASKGTGTVEVFKTPTREAFASGVATPGQERKGPDGGTSKETEKAPGDDLGDVVGEVFSTPASEVFATAVAVPGKDHERPGGDGTSKGTEEAPEDKPERSTRERVVFKLAPEHFATGVSVPGQERKGPDSDGASKETEKAPGDDLGDVVGEVYSTPAPSVFATVMTEAFATAVSTPGQERKGPDGGGASKETEEAPADGPGDVVGEVFSAPASGVFVTVVAVPGKEHEGPGSGGGTKETEEAPGDGRSGSGEGRNGDDESGDGKNGDNENGGEKGDDGGSGDKPTSFRRPPQFYRPPDIYGSEVDLRPQPSSDGSDGDGGKKGSSHGINVIGQVQNTSPGAGPGGGRSRVYATVVGTAGGAATRRVQVTVVRTDSDGQTHTQVVRPQTYVTTDVHGKVRTLFYAMPVRATVRVTTDRHGVTRTYTETVATAPPTNLRTAVTTDKHGKVQTVLLFGQGRAGAATGTGHRDADAGHTGHLFTTTDADGHKLTLQLDGTRTKPPSHLVTVVSTFSDGQVKTLLYEAHAANASDTKGSGRLDRLRQNKHSSSVNYRVYYFSGQYLPTVVSVLLALAWRVVDTDIKRMEPFYALSRADGAPGAAMAENLLFMHAWVVPVQAARRHQWAVSISAVVHGPLLAAVQLLASSTVFLATATGCEAFATKRTCGDPFLAMNPKFARALQAVLGLVAALVIALAVLQYRRRSLLRAEPWSLAGLATLLADWRAVRPGFDGVAVTDSEAAVARRVAARRFRLAHSLLHDQPHLGLEAVHGPFEGTTPAAPDQRNGRDRDDQGQDDRDDRDDRDDQDDQGDRDNRDDRDDRDDRDGRDDRGSRDDRGGRDGRGDRDDRDRDGRDQDQDGEGSHDRNQDHDSHSIAGTRRPIMLSLPVVLFFIAGLLGLMVSVMVYRFTPNSHLEHFLDGQSAAVKALFVLFGVLVRCGWEPIEREVRHIEVFRELSLRHRSGRVLLRDPVRAVPLTSVLVSLWQGQGFVALVGTVGLLIEALVVVLPGVPYAGTETWEDANVCMLLSASVLLAAAVTAAAALLRRRHLSRRVPRAPYTLAVIAAYLYAARMLDAFAGLSVLPPRVRDRRIAAATRGRTYGLGWTCGADGVRRVGVDEEELDGDYRPAPKHTAGR